MEEEYNVASRYRTVRKHLDSLGYKHTLTLDALPLIEKLLADLIQTTESLKHFKTVAQENIEAHTQLQSKVDPYKCDNVKLIQECNQLRLDLAKEKENHQKQVKDLKKEIGKLECKCSDLQLVFSSNLHRLKELETESARKSKRILELQGKCLKPIVTNVGLASKKRPVFPFRRPVLEGEPIPKLPVKSNSLPVLSVVEPKVIDLLSMADHKMNCLNHEITKLREELSIQSDNVQTLKCQLTNKEKEILWLKKMLEGGRPYSIISKDYVSKKAENDHAISNYNFGEIEVKVLQQEKLELEQQLREALNKQHDAMSQALKLADRNEELEKELKDIDHIAQAVEADCNFAVIKNNRRISKLQEKLEDMMARVHVLESELNVERREVHELKTDLEACKLEKMNIQCSLDSVLSEKKQMSDRINELTVIEKNLSEEIERMVRENEMQRQDIVHLQYSNKTLKDHLNSKGLLLNEHESNFRTVRDKGQKNDCNKGQSDTEFKEIFKEREFRNENDIIKQLDQKNLEIQNLHQMLEQLEGERDFYKNQCNNIHNNFNKTAERDHIDMWSRIRELKRQLNEKENALDDLQREKKELLREKTNLESRLKTYAIQRETTHCNHYVCKRGTMCNCSSQVGKDTNNKKGIIEHLEHDLDMTRADVNRLIEERDALHERLKIASEAHTSEQRRLREHLTQVEIQLKQIQKERQELFLSQGTQKVTISGLEDQLQDLREELKRTKQELEIQHTQYFQLRALQDQTDRALGDSQNQLSQSESELNRALDHNRSLEKQQVQLENQLKDLQQEINNLKGNMTQLDRNKDELLMVLDEKTEKIASLERELILKEKLAMECDQQIRELQRKNELCVDQSASQGRHLRSVQMEVENLQRQLEAATYDRENAIRDNQRVQDDLAATTCEIRNLQRELEASRAESFDLKRQLQTYISEVRRAEELLNRKENERTEMLNHFKSLSLEATVLENNNQSLESEAAEARGALQSATDQILNLQQQCTDKDCLIRGCETQINELTQSMASLETQLRQQEEQRHRADSDLTALRDLCMKLDEQKDQLMQQLDDKDRLKAQYDMQIASLKAEQAVIQDQMNTSRATAERLEMLLDQSRQESMTSQAKNQELQNEVSRLKAQISELQDKLSSESIKLRQYQTQAAEYSKQISELRRQVTNEKFDRARKEEENRKQSESPSNSIAQTPLPKNLSPTETAERKSRYLQNERSIETNGKYDRSWMKIVYPLAEPTSGPSANEDYGCRCNHAKEFHRDIPSINIILRTDCKMHSNMYNYVQKDNVQDEGSQTFYDEVQFHKLGRIDEHKFNSKKENQEMLSKNMKYEKDSEKKEESFVNDTSKTLYNHGLSFSYDIPNFDIPKTKLSEIYEEMKLKLAKDTPEIAEKIDKMETNLNQHKFNNFPETSYNFCVRKFNNNSENYERSQKASEICQPNLSYNLLKPEKIIENCVKAPETKLKSILKERQNLFETDFNFPSKNLKETTENSVKCPSNNTNYSKSLNTENYNSNNLMKHDKASNPLFENTSALYSERNSNEKRNLIGNDKVHTFFLSVSEKRNMADTQTEENEDFCTETNCPGPGCSIKNNSKQSESTDKSTNVKSNNKACPIWKKYFPSIKCEDKCISTIHNLQDTLQNMSNHTKNLKYHVQDNTYQHKEIRCKNSECNIPNVKANLDSSDVKHNHHHSLLKRTTPDCLKMLQEIKKHAETLENQLTIKNKNTKSKRKINGNSNVIFQSYCVNQQTNTLTQNPNKKDVQETCHNYCCCENLCNSMKQMNNSILNNETKDTTMEEFYRKNVDKGVSTDRDKNHRTSYSKSRNVRNADVQCETMFSFYMPHLSSVLPIATSTPKKLRLSNYTQTSSTLVEGLQAGEIKQTEETNQPKEPNRTMVYSTCTNEEIKCSVSDKNDIAIFLLMKSMDGKKCLKSKYKQLQLLNFKPRDTWHSNIIHDNRCKLFKSKSQMSVHLKLKAVECKPKNESRCEKNMCLDLLKDSQKHNRLNNMATSVCTQSSDLQITAATSVSSISLKYSNRNQIDKNMGAKDGCRIS